MIEVVSYGIGVLPTVIRERVRVGKVERRDMGLTIEDFMMRGIK